MSAGEDENRWAEAQRIVDGLPSEVLEARVRRTRRLTVLLVLALVILSVAAGLAAVAWFGDEPDVQRDEPLWQDVASVALTFVALVAIVVGVVGQWRAHRRLGGLRSPLMVLHRRQQQRLLHQLRGTVPVDPAHVPLVRHLAERLAAQRWLLIGQLGLLLSFVGQLIGSPSAWRLGLVVLFALGIAVVLPLVLRNERQAHRFLAEHPPQRAD